MLEGLWNGRYNTGSTNYFLKVYCFKEENKLKAICTISYEYSGESTIVQEIMEGDFIDKMIKFEAKKVYYIHKGKSYNYLEDTFELYLNEESNEMFGRQYSKKKNSNPIILIKEEDNAASNKG